jgi:hypothetical protein
VQFPETDEWASGPGVIQAIASFWTLAYVNAIIPQVAAEFIGVFMEYPFRKPLAAAILAALTTAPVANPAEARHSARWYLAHGYHRGPVKGFIKDQPADTLTLKKPSTSPLEAAKAAPAREADTPPLRIIGARPSPESARTPAPAVDTSPILDMPRLRIGPIVNGRAMPRTGSAPPSWAGELHVSPVLYRPQSASTR